MSDATGLGSAKDVMVVILTHNAPDDLERCLKSLIGQTAPPHHVLVVDNSSTPPAGPVAACLFQGREDFTVLRCEENIGPAGGYAVGLRRFLESGYRYAWVMDDDCEPEPDCLMALLAELAGLDCPALILPTEIDTSRGTVTNYPAWCGIMISREIVASVGLPMAELFWWTEDTEYLQWRIPEAGHAVRRAQGAVVYHHRNRENRTRPDWKIYYETRNTLYYRLHVQQPRKVKRLLRLVRSVARAGAEALFVRPSPRRISLFVRALVDGCSGNLGKTVPIDR